MDKRCYWSRFSVGCLLALIVVPVITLWEKDQCLCASAFVAVGPPAVTLKQQRHAPSNPLFLLVNRPNGHDTRGINNNSNNNNGSAPPPPLSFLIEPLPESGPVNPAIFEDIARMCIAAFFNDGDEQKKTPLWKGIQLAYLRNLQSGDLRLRRMERHDSNFMLVARRVVPVGSEDKIKGMSNRARAEPLILDLRAVQNLPVNANGMQHQDFVRGEILGFVEVTQRPYGLGQLESLFPATNKNSNGDDKHVQHGSQEYKRGQGTVRPILTNLSVNYSARRSGVGSALVQRCEEEVIRRWNQREIVLEVEEDNVRALTFYKKRGYKILFEDPTSRRYDVNGLWLQKKRCKRYVLRKELSFVNPLLNVQPISPQEVKMTWNKGLETLRKLRDNVLAGSNA